MKSATPLIVALCLAGAVFGWKAQRAWFSSSITLDASEPPDVSLKTEETGMYPRKDYNGAVASIIGRPLFRQDRRPFGIDDELAPESFEQILSHLSMIGVTTFGKSVRGIVVVADGQQTELLELKVGDSLKGFKVKKVMEDGITMTAAEKDYLLPLYAGPPTVDEKSLRTDVKNTSARKPGPVPRQGASPNQPGARPPAAASPYYRPPTTPPNASRAGVPARQQQNQAHDEDNSGENQ